MKGWAHGEIGELIDIIDLAWADTLLLSLCNSRPYIIVWCLYSVFGSENGPSGGWIGAAPPEKRGGLDRLTEECRFTPCGVHSHHSWANTTEDLSMREEEAGREYA
jgi:hypothetical protein